MSYELVVVPGKSIGPYKLGMTRAEIWAQHDSPILSFFKTSVSKQRTDDIQHLGVHVYYDANGHCNFLEAWTVVKYFDPTLLFAGVRLKGKEMSEVRDILRQRTIVYTEDASGFESRGEGIGFYCHTFESENSLLDGVSIFPAEANQSLQTNALDHT